MYRFFMILFLEVRYHIYFILSSNMTCPNPPASNVFGRYQRIYGDRRTTVRVFQQALGGAA